MSIDMSNSDEDKRLLRESVSRLVADKIEPFAKVIDETGEMPEELYEVLTKTGLNAATVPSQYGGGGASALDGVILVEEIARGSASVSSILAMNLAGVAALAASLNEKLKEDLFPKVVRGEVILSWSANAPEAEGELIAADDAKGLVLNGKVTWVPFVDVGAAIVVLAEAKTQLGSHLVAIDTSKLKGHLEIGPLESDLGLRGVQLRSLVLRDVVITGEEIVDSKVGGASVLGVLHAVGRAAVAAQANGIAAAALGHAKRYVGERYQFGVPIAEFQSTRAILGAMALNLEAARQLTYAAGNQLDTGATGWGSQDRAPADSAAKWFASKVAVEVAIDAIQLFGGYGFVKDYPVERLMRDAKLTQMILGTNQILDIADAILSR